MFARGCNRSKSSDILYPSIDALTSVGDTSRQVTALSGSYAFEASVVLQSRVLVCPPSQSGWRLSILAGQAKIRAAEVAFLPLFC